MNALCLLALCLLAQQPSRLYDVRDYGAVPDDGTPDDRAANAAVAACSKAGGGVVYAPRGRWDLAAPVNLTGVANVTLRGDGAATVLGMSGQYCGPAVAVGMPCTSQPPERRPPSPLATATPKRSLATGGAAVLTLAGHPLQLGHLSPQLRPDCWAGPDPITWDLAFSLPSGPPPPGQWATVCGMGDPWQNPAPWLLRVVDGSLVLALNFVGDVQWHRLDVPLTPGRAVYRVSIQVDPATGRAAAWSDGRLVTAAFRPGWGEAVPPLSLVPHDGVTAFMAGYSGPRMDARASSITDVTLHGLRVSRGPVYQWDGPNPGQQAFAGRPELPLTDDARYFTGAGPVVPPGALVALLPLDPEPDGSPWVTVLTDRGPGLAAWCPPLGWWTTTGVAVEDLRVSGGQQTAILLGSVGNLALRRVTSDDGVLQGLGTLPLNVSYPIYLDQCSFSGRDAAVVSFWQMVEARGVQLGVIGRHGIRAAGGDCLWDGLKVWRSCPYTESVARLVGQDDGLSHEFRRVMYDNEDWTPTRAVVEVVQGYGQPGRVRVDGFAVSATGDSPFVRLTGHGGATNPYQVSLRGLTCYGACKVALRCDGPPSFSGEVDLTLLKGATVAGSAGAVAVTPQSALYPPPAPPMPPPAPPTAAP